MHHMVLPALRFTKIAPFLLILSLFLPLTVAKAQILKPYKWTYTVEPAHPKLGQTAELVFKAKLDAGWHLYGPKTEASLPLVFAFAANPAIQVLGKVQSVGAKRENDTILGGMVEVFYGSAELRQKIKLLKPDATITGSMEGQNCTDAGRCVPFSEDFLFAISAAKEDGVKPVKATSSATNNGNEIAGNVDSEATAIAAAPPDGVALDSASTEEAAAQADSATRETANTVQSIQVQAASTSGQNTGGLWGFFLLAFLSGFIALLTPCVFPMIPMTVSFFTRNAASRAKALGNAWLYAGSIVALYVLIGVIFSRLNGPEFANFISTHWLPNVLFFAIFLIFGFSFLGYFEILLPSSWGNAADERAEKGGIAGIFFMALTLVIVSFSCTGPIASTVLVQSAGGAILKPVVGMLGFSLAFALPFGLFAAFPHWLSSLPRSGSWMVTVKAVLGFLELALALKFLSVADQAYHWHLLDREIYLAFWIVIFSMLGFYLLGKIRLPHDDDVSAVGWGRLGISIFIFTFVVYLIPGLFGAPLKALAGYIPPRSSLDFDLTKNSIGASTPSTPNTLCESPKYADFLHLPHGLQGYFDYRQGLACAKATGKPLFIDFTGHGCVNCREMEARVWSDPRILTLLKDKFVVTALYVDDKTDLPETAWYTSKYDGKVKKTVGKQNADFQITRFNNNAQPFYLILDGDGNLIAGPQAYDLSVDNFEAFLKRGLTAP